MSDRPIPPQAVEVLQAFLAASDKKDEEAMKACVSKQTIEAGQMNTEGAEGMEYHLGDPVWEGDNVVIPMRAVPTAESPQGVPEMEMQCLMVEEDGQWKFDLMETMNRLMGGDLGEMMDQMADMMKDTMEGLGEAMAEGMKAAFGEGESVSDDNVKDENDDDPPDLRLT